ncbi:MAG: uroporphyrinogen decarboxylase [Gammaproteobacteria bacterium]|nr:uroporphyrinogen decarboxylase [Gammaproteobacteria bacterium]
MTPLEILTAAATGAPAPRVPVFCNLLDQGARELGMSQREYYSRGANVAAGQLAMQRRYGHDNVWSLFYVGREAELLGCREILYADDGAPNVADFVIKDWDDVARLEVPADLTAHPAWAEQAECLRILREEVGGRIPICAYLTASNSLPAILMGMEKWIELLMMGPVDVRDNLLAKCSLFFRRQFAAYAAAGANVFLYSTPFGSTYLVGRKRFEAWALPWMKRDLLDLDRTGIVYYCGMTPFGDVIPTVMDELGVTLHYLSPLEDLYAAKADIAARGCDRPALACGVIDDIKMIRWTPQETRAEVHRLCEIGKPGGHFLLGTGLMPMALPEASIRAFVEAGMEYGRLP